MYQCCIFDYFADATGGLSKKANIRMVVPKQPSTTSLYVLQLSYMVVQVGPTDTVLQPF